MNIIESKGRGCIKGRRNIEERKGRGGWKEGRKNIEESEGRG